MVAPPVNLLAAPAIAPRGAYGEELNRFTVLGDCGPQSLCEFGHRWRLTQIRIQFQYRVWT
jgi:hypothetical protein